MPASLAQRWKPEEDALLRKLIEVDGIMATMAGHHVPGRSLQACAARASHLGIVSPHATRTQTNGWTAKEDQVLRKGYRDRLTCAQIASKLPGRSRSSVIGRLHRLGLKASHVTPRPPRPAAPPKRARLAKDVAAEHATRTRLQRAAARPPAAPLEYVRADLSTSDVDRHSRCLSLSDLETHHCRWPSAGDGPVTFCGHDAVPGQSYCAHHAARAFRAPVVPIPRVPRDRNVVKVSYVPA